MKSTSGIGLVSSWLSRSLSSSSMPAESMRLVVPLNHSVPLAMNFMKVGSVSRKRSTYAVFMINGHRVRRIHAP